MATAQTRKRERRAAVISFLEGDEFDDERRPEEIKRPKTQLSKPTVTARKLKEHAATSAVSSQQASRRRSRNAGAALSQVGGLELTAPGSSLANSPLKSLKLTDPSSTRRLGQSEIRTASISARNTPSPGSKQGYRTRKKSESPSKSLHTYFQRSTREQSWASSQNTAVTIDEVDDIQDDDIEEFLSDDEELGKLLNEEVKEIESRARSNLGNHLNHHANATLDWQKPSRATVHQLSLPKSAASTLLTTAPTARSTRFILPGATSVGSASSTQVSNTTEQRQDDHSTMRPWADQYPPVNLAELAVHKKKVSDVQRWLSDVFAGRSLQRILVLRGPAGSGKTITVSILAKVLGYEIIEWRQPLVSEYSSMMNSTSLSTQFDEFLGRGEKFGALALTGDDESTIPQKRGPGNEENQRRVILVEEFPNFLGQASVGLSAFRVSLQRYLASTVPIGYSSVGHSPDSPPIVMIVSETMLGSANGAFDSFSAYRLLGPEISNHPGIGFIDFNPVAPTFMAKAIDLALKKYTRQTNRRPNVSPAMLKPFYGSGDIRSAISAVEFLCLRDPAQDYLDRRLATSKSRKSFVTGVVATEDETLQTITQREASLGLFHATAKVVHNKRDPSSHVRDKSGPAPTPPAHMQQHARPLISQVEVDNLMNETGTDVSTFLASLHENFPLSCSGSSFAAKYDSCMEYLSNADLLESDSHKNLRSGRLGLGSARSSLQGYSGGIDMLRQDEMSFHVG
ncbi:Cell cycle checkpoint protein rad17, partial [Ascosphaera aggregata]